MMLPVVAGGGRRILPRSLRKSSSTLAKSETLLVDVVALTHRRAA